MKSKSAKFNQWLPLLALLIGIGCFFAFGLDRYLSFQSIKEHRDILLHWTSTHYFLTVVSYILIYIATVALSVPGAVFLTLTGGFLFGIPLGVCYVVISATIGATLLFLVVRSALGGWIAQKAGKWVNRMKKGFQEDAFNYILFLRLIPIFPFWIVNIVSAVMDVKLVAFITATFIGIIPGSLVYVSIGNGLNSIFASDRTPDLGIIFTPSILLPLLGLAILSLLPILYKKYKRKQQ